MIKYEITRDQIIELALKSDKASIWLQQNFKDAFKNTLEVGRWYNVYFQDSDEKWGLLFVKEIKGKEVYVYGFNEGKWIESNYGIHNKFIEATELEVFEALKNEASKRGFVEGAYLKNHHGTWELLKINYTYSEKYNNGIYNRQGTGKWVFINGKWAEIIPTKTKEQAEKELKCKIID